MPTTWDALVILLFFALPGFIGDRMLTSAMARAQREPTEVALSVLLWSILNYVLCSPLVYWLITSKTHETQPLAAAALWAIVVLMAPLLEAIILTKLLGPDRLAAVYRFLGLRVHPIPRSWDYAFSRGIPYLVLLTLTDGTRIGGLWGSNSFVSSYPADEDIYIEALWSLGENGEFREPVPLSAGALVKRSDIRYLELFAVKEEPATDEQ